MANQLQNVIQIPRKGGTTTPRPYIEPDPIVEIARENRQTEYPIMHEDFERQEAPISEQINGQQTRNLPITMNQVKQGQLQTSFMSSQVMGIPMWAFAIMLVMGIYIVFWKNRE